jgi:putative membrane protein
MWGSGMGHGWGGPLLLLGLIAICVLIFLLIRRSGCCGCHHHHGACHMRGHAPGTGPGWSDPTYSALQILNERFARGEIQKQEYEEKKAAILGGSR